MSSGENVDAYTDSVLRRIDPQVLDSLSPDQLLGIKEGISASKPYSRHPVDWRGVLPTFFARYYFVILMGRDRRTSTIKEEIQRKRKGALAGGALFLMFALSPLLVLVGIVLYVFKSAAGIDVVEGQHAWDFLWKLLE